MKFYKVTHYAVQVKYNMPFDLLDNEDFYDMARAKQDKGVDCFEDEEILPEHEALALDGKIFVDNNFPCSHIATVSWSYITGEA